MKTQLIIFILCFFFVGCSGCSQSGSNRSRSLNETFDSPRSEFKRKNVIKMTESNGVFELPIEINNTKMSFIFDTGASDVIISSVEAIYLIKQGTLTDDDIIGTEYFLIADGSISEGTVINLKSVKIGHRTLENVKATVMESPKAPLLLGQSALAKFGKVSIDYQRKEITFD